MKLISFIAHPNPQIRLGAIEGAVPYSLTHPKIFKIHELQPVRNLKVLLRDHPVCLPVQARARLLGALVDFLATSCVLREKTNHPLTRALASL